jgi:hypothetical protein
MKLTKQKLQQIIKEELDNMMAEESSSDYAKAEEYLRAVYSTAKDGKIDRKVNQGIITALRDGADSNIGPMDPQTVLNLSHKVQRDMGIELVGGIGFSGFKNDDEDPEAGMARAYAQNPTGFSRGT